MKYLLTFTSLFTIYICSFLYAAAPNEIQYGISKNGLPGMVEISMELKDLQSKGLICEKMVFISKEFEEKYNYTEEFGQTYRIDSLGIEFQIKHSKIIRIWFFTDRNPLFKIFLPKDNEYKNMCQISAVDIIRNYGPVKKYIDETPPQKSEPQWSKYSPLGVFTNQISYPKLTFFFGLTKDDNLSYITVSNMKSNKAD